MRRKMVAIVLGGAIAGAASALVALAMFTGHGATADGGQPSTLLESASGSGGANLATAPSWPGQTGGGSRGGGSGTAAGRSQSGGGSVVVHGVSPTQAPAPSGGGQTGGGSSGSGGGGGVLPSLPGVPTVGASGSVTATLPTVTASSTSSSAASSTSSSSSTSTSTSTSTTTTKSTSTSTSSGGLVTVCLPAVGCVLK